MSGTPEGWAGLWDTCDRCGARLHIAEPAECPCEDAPPVTALRLEDRGDVVAVEVRGAGCLARLAVRLPATLRAAGCGLVHLARLPCGAVEVRRGDDVRRLRAQGVRMLPWGSEEVRT